MSQAKPPKIETSPKKQQATLFGNHGFHTGANFDKKKQKVFDVLSNFAKVLEATTPQNSGLKIEEINSFRMLLNNFNGQLGQIQQTSEYERLGREAQGKIKEFNEIKKERSEDINGLINKIETIKELNDHLFYLRERYMDEAQKQASINQEGDLRNILFFIEKNAKCIQSRMNDKKLSKKKSQVKKQKQILVDLNLQLDDFNKRQHGLIVKQIENESGNLRKQQEQVDIEFGDVVQSNENVSQRVNELDGYMSDDNEQELFDKLKQETNTFFDVINVNQHNISDVKNKVKDLDESLNMIQVPFLFQQISSFIQAMEIHKKELSDKMSIILQTAYRKSCKKDEELEQLEFILKDMISQLNKDINLIALKGHKLQSKQELLFECLLKSNIRDMHMPQIRNYLHEMNSLLMQIQELDERRKTCQEEFDEALPSIVLENRIKRRQQNINESEQMSGSISDQTLNSQLSDTELAKLKNSDDTKKLVSFAIKFRQTIIQMQGCLVKYQILKLEILKKYAELEKSISELEKTRYKPEKGDEIDKYLSHYCNAANIDLDIERIDPGVYRIGKKKIHFMLKTEGLYMRRGAGIANAHVFLDSFYQKTCSKIQDINQNDNLSDKFSRKRSSSKVSQTPRRTKLNKQMTTITPKVNRIQTQNKLKPISVNKSNNALSQSSLSPVKLREDLSTGNKSNQIEQKSMADTKQTPILKKSDYLSNLKLNKDPMNSEFIQTNRETNNTSRNSVLQQQKSQGIMLAPPQILQTPKRTRITKVGSGSSKISRSGLSVGSQETLTSLTTSKTKTMTPNRRDKQLSSNKKLLGTSVGLTKQVGGIRTTTKVPARSLQLSGQGIKSIKLLKGECFKNDKNEQLTESTGINRNNKEQQNINKDL